MQLQPIERVALTYPVHLHGADVRPVERLRLAHPDVSFVSAPAETKGTSSAARKRMLSRVTDVDALVCLDLPLDLLNSAWHLQWVQTVSTGVDHLPVDELMRRGILLTNAAGTAAPEIAEFVLARIFEQFKQLPAIARAAANRTWLPIYGSPIAGTRLGLLGFGPINIAVAELARSLSMQVRVCRRSPGAFDTAVPPEFSLLELKPFLEWCDVVVVALPETADTIGLLDREAFEALTPGTFLINVGRGSVVDETALLGALDAGCLSGAALDVFAEEPLPPGHSFYKHPLIRVSAHCSSIPRISIQRVLALFSSNLALIQDNLPPLNEI